MQELDFMFRPTARQLARKPSLFGWAVSNCLVENPFAGYSTFKLKLWGLFLWIIYFLFWMHVHGIRNIVTFGVVMCSIY